MRASRLWMWFVAGLLTAVALAGCSAAPSPSPTSAATPVSTVPSAEPTPGLAMCDAFELVQEVLSPAYFSFSDGLTSEEDLANTLDEVADQIADLEDPERETAEQLLTFAQHYRREATFIRAGDSSYVDSALYYSDLLDEHLERCP